MGPRLSDYPLISTDTRTPRSRERIPQLGETRAAARASGQMSRERARRRRRISVFIGRVALAPGIRIAPASHQRTGGFRREMDSGVIQASCYAEWAWISEGSPGDIPRHKLQREFNRVLSCGESRDHKVAFDSTRVSQMTFLTSRRAIVHLS